MAMVGTIKPSKYQDLVVGDSRMDSKGEKKSNPKKPHDQKKYKSKSHEESSSSNKNSQKKKGKGEMTKWKYCGKGYHPKSYCMKKQIYMLTQLLENPNIYLHGGVKKKEGASNFEDKERVHALVASTIRSFSFIIDFGTSINAILTREAFSSPDSLNRPKIYWGMTLKLKVKGRLE